MKTQIITLESHDDLISVRDKLSWAKTPRILLVWPKYEEVGLRLLDLKVLQRHADSLGAQLGLVTRRANVRRDAQSLQIPVFESTGAAQRDKWPESLPRSRRIPNAPRRDLRQVRETVRGNEAPWRTSLVGRMLAFTIGVMAVLAIAAIFLPHARMTLYPESQAQSVVIPVAAGESVASVSITGSVPARKLSIVVDADQSLALVNEIPVPNSKAQGIARFTNLGRDAVNLPAGLVVSTVGEAPIRFVTLHPTLLDPGPDVFVDVPIEALQAGSSGNAAVGTIKAVEGPLSLSISVSNPNVLSGGGDLKRIGATQADRAELRAVVLDNLRREAESKLRGQISASDILLMDTFELTQIIEETYDPPEGLAGKTLSLKMQVEYAARFVSDTDLRELAGSTVDLSIPDGFEPLDAAAYKPITDPSTDASGLTHFELEVTRTLIRKVNAARVFSIVRGQRVEAIKDDLSASLSLRSASDIALTPAWWPWLPLIPFNIVVETR